MRHSESDARRDASALGATRYEGRMEDVFLLERPFRFSTLVYYLAPSPRPAATRTVLQSTEPSLVLMEPLLDEETSVPRHVHAC